MTEFMIVLIVSFLWHAMGVTIGYHRLLSHRSFRCPKIVEYFWVLGGYLAFEGSPIWWATMHRAHHRYVETNRDPHTPKRGLKYAYYGWMFQHDYPAYIDPKKLSKDLLRDPIYRFLNQNGSWKKAHWLTFFIGVAFRLLLLVFFGWQVFLANTLAAVAVLQVPLLLNVVCHIPKLGYKTYALEDDSVNVWWVGLLAMGEGWHNNHHAFPGSARSGLLPHEIDLSWLTLRLMKALRLVTWMNEAKPGQTVLTRNPQAIRL
jgi:fatty-acid desaturase